MDRPVGDCMSFPMPDPPMALYPDWEDWKEAALNWIEQQDDSWTADDLRQAMEPGRSNWPGSVINTASRRNLIELTGRVVKSSVKSRKGSLLPVWRTK